MVIAAHITVVLLNGAQRSKEPAPFGCGQGWL